MKKIILLALVAVIMAGCIGRVSKTDVLLNDGHDYAWVHSTKLYLVHSPECRRCERVRYQEIKHYIDSVLKDRAELEKLAKQIKEK